MKNVTYGIVIVVASVLLLAFFAQAMNTVVDVDAAKTSREKACANPRNTQVKDPKFCAHLIVIKKVDGGTASPSDFTISVTSTGKDGPSPSSFPGSSSPGTSVTLGQGSYQVTETGIADNYEPSYSSACSGTISAGQTKTCTVTNTFTPTTGTLTVIKYVLDGTAQPSDFTISVTGNSPSPSEFQGDSSGTTVKLGQGTYQVTETGNPGDYTPNYSEDCSGSISAGQTKTCAIDNRFTPPPTTGTLIVTKQVVGGTATPSDFTIFVDGNNASPDTFQGDSSGTTVTLGEGDYISGESLQAGYSATFSGDCSGTISAGQTKTCTITNTFTGP